MALGNSDDVNFSLKEMQLGKRLRSEKKKQCHAVPRAARQTCAVSLRGAPVASPGQARAPNSYGCLRVARREAWHSPGAHRVRPGVRLGALPARVHCRQGARVTPGRSQRRLCGRSAKTRLADGHAVRSHPHCINRSLKPTVPVNSTGRFGFCVVGKFSEVICTLGSSKQARTLERGSHR